MEGIEPGPRNCFASYLGLTNPFNRDQPCLHWVSHREFGFRNRLIVNCEQLYLLADCPVNANLVPNLLLSPKLSCAQGNQWIFDFGLISAEHDELTSASRG